MKFKYNYKKVDGRLRPIIPIKIGYDGNFVRYEVLVDSGADLNIVPAEIGEAISIDILKGKKANVGGVVPGKKDFYIHPVSISVGGYSYSDIEVGFMPGMPVHHTEHYGVVGQKGFFDLFKITFDLVKAEIELQPYDVR